MAKGKKTAQNKQSANRSWVWVIAIVAVAVIGLAAFNLMNQGSSPAAQAAPREISVDTAYEKREAGAFILDVREQYEWDQVHIPGATLIPLAQLPNRLSEVPAGQEIVVVCRSGNRSQEGRDILRSAGFEQVSSMAGGMNVWSAKGYPTASGQ